MSEPSLHAVQNGGRHQYDTKNLIETGLVTREIRMETLQSLTDSTQLKAFLDDHIKNTIHESLFIKLTIVD